jgi:chromosomal replication initiation ATPase DnaA
MNKPERDWIILGERPTVLQIAEDRARAAGFTLADILDHGWTRALADCRNSIYAACRAAGYSYPQIGRRLNRDHSTVLSGARRDGKKIAAVHERVVAPWKTNGSEVVQYTP